MCAPCEQTKFFSITTVFMDSGAKEGKAVAFDGNEGNGEGDGDEKGVEVLSGQYHQVRHLIYMCTL